MAGQFGRDAPRDGRERQAPWLWCLTPHPFADPRSNTLSSIRARATSQVGGVVILSHPLVHPAPGCVQSDGLPIFWLLASEMEPKLTDQPPWPGRGDYLTRFNLSSGVLVIIYPLDNKLKRGISKWWVYRFSEQKSSIADNAPSFRPNV